MSLPVPKDRDIQYCSDLYLQGLVVVCACACLCVCACVRVCVRACVRACVRVCVQTMMSYMRYVSVPCKHFSYFYVHFLTQPELKTLELPVKYKDIYQCSLSTNVNPPCVVLMDVKKVV